MRAEIIETNVEIPEGVTVTKNEDSTFVVKGSKGELTRRLYHAKIETKVEGNEVQIVSKQPTMREKKMIFTHRSHLRNMIKGVTDGFEYKLKVCSGHFPMTVAVKGDVFEVKNFSGESVPRKLQINPETKVQVEGADVTVTGKDIELTGQMAARIESLCRRANFDKRIFQDGIYITHKNGRVL